MAVFVLRTNEVEKTLEFYQTLGLTFVQEQHGNGPVHYACESNGNVFEIYPQGKDGQNGFKFI